MTAAIPGQTFTDAPTGRSIVVEATEPTDGYIHLWVANAGDGPSVLLTPAQTRELAVALLARVELLERR